MFDPSETNPVISPVSIYLALGMLAETADGSSLEEILDCVGADSIDELRKSCNGMWNVLYRDDTDLKSRHKQLLLAGELQLLCTLYYRTRVVLPVSCSLTHS